MSTRNKARTALRGILSLAFSIGMLALLPSTAAAQGFFGFADFCTADSYDNAKPPPPGTQQQTGLFTDLRHGDLISAGYGDLTVLPDVESRPLNFNGATGAAGDMWITLLDAPGDPSPAPEFQCVITFMWLKIHKFDNRKAVGVVMNYDPETWMGLFWGVYDNGNSDALSLSTFDGQTGKLKNTVATLPLKSKIKEDVPYALVAEICEAGTEDAFAFGHVTDDPEAEGDTLFVDLSVLPPGISPVGQIGIAGYAKNAFVDAAAYAFLWDGE